MAAAKDAEILSAARGLSACIVTLDADFHGLLGSEAALLDKAAAIGRRWLRGLGILRSLAN